MAFACGGEPATDAAPTAAAQPDAAAPASEPQTASTPKETLHAVAPGSLFGGDSDESAFAAGGDDDASNEAPIFVSVETAPKGEIRTTDDLTAMPRARDPEGDPISFRYRWSVNGRELRVDGPTLTASHFDRGDRIELSVEASDGHNTSHPFAIEPRDVINSTPEITSAPGPLEADGTFRYAIAVEDADGDRSFGFALREGPEGMKLDEVGGRIEWTPSPEQAGVHPVVIEVDDRNEGVAQQAFDLTIEFPEAAVPAAAAP